MFTCWFVCGGSYNGRDFFFEWIFDSQQQYMSEQAAEAVSKQLSQAVWPKKKTATQHRYFSCLFLSLWGEKILGQSRQSCFSETFSRYTEPEPHRGMTHSVSGHWRWEGEGLWMDLYVKQWVVWATEWLIYSRCITFFYMKLCKWQVGTVTRLAARDRGVIMQLTNCKHSLYFYYRHCVARNGKIKTPLRPGPFR